MHTSLATLSIVSVAAVVFGPALQLREEAAPTITNGTVTVGFNMPCGGTISDIHTKMVSNLVNNGDCTGRQIQLAVYDGNASYVCCYDPWGWNPVQGGDKHGHGSPVLSSLFTGDTSYIRTRPLEWSPEWRGGDANTPITSDMEFEQWVSFVPGMPHVVRVHYRLTHLGVDTHAEALQEVPATYVNTGYDLFTRYAGPAPWTGGIVTQTIPPDFRDPAGRYLAATEEWWAFVGDPQVGLTVYLPSQYRMAWSAHSMPSQTNYATPFVPFSVGPNEVRTATIYLVVGWWQRARANIGELRLSAGPDLLPPVGVIDVPESGGFLTGIVQMQGWAFDNDGLRAVEILLDESGVLATATLGVTRPDVVASFPIAPMDSGWVANVNTGMLPAGPHTLSLRLTDIHGNVAVTLRRSIMLR